MYDYGIPNCVPEYFREKLKERNMKPSFDGNGQNIIMQTKKN